MTHLDEQRGVQTREQLLAGLSALPSSPVSELGERMRDRAESYRIGGLSSEHTAALLDEAASTLTTLSTRNAELEAENARLKEARHFWKTEYLNASADAAKFANDLVRAEAQRDEALKALEPFAAIEWADEDGSHDSPYRERVCDWFGPSDFRTARRVREGGNVDG